MAEVLDGYDAVLTYLLCLLVLLCSSHRLQKVLLTNKRWVGSDGQAITPLPKQQRHSSTLMMAGKITTCLVVAAFSVVYSKVSR